MASRAMGAPSSPSIALSASSTPKERCSPSSPENVKMTQSTPGAKSTAATAVGSHAKKKMTIAKSAKTTAEKNAVRVRNSIARSLRAMSSATSRVLGIARYELAVRGDIRSCLERRPLFVAHEPPTVHDRRVRRQGESLLQVVRHEHQRRAARAQVHQRRRERRGARRVESGEGLV